MTSTGAWRAKCGVSGVLGGPVHAPKGERGVRGAPAAAAAEVEDDDEEVVGVWLAVVVSTALGGLTREEEDEMGLGRRRTSSILMEVLRRAGSFFCSDKFIERGKSCKGEPRVYEAICLML